MRTLVVVVCLAVGGVASAQPAPNDGPPSKTLERAIKLYDKEDYFSASVEFAKVVQGENGDSPGNLQRADFFLGKAIFKLGYPLASLTRFATIVGQPNHMYRRAALKWVAAVIDVVPAPGSRGPLIGISMDDLEDPTLDRTKDQLRYHAGVVAVERNETDARRFLTAALGSAFTARAELALARLELRRGDMAPAVAAVMTAAKDPAVISEAVHELAAWAHAKTGDRAALARVLDELAPRDPMAAFQASRIALEARGKFRDLPAVPVGTFDAVVIATACLGGATSDARERVMATTSALRSTLDPVLAIDDNAEIYDAVEKLRHLPITKPSLAAIRIALSDPDMLESIAWNTQLAVELEKLDHADKAWQTTMVAAEVLQELTVQISVASADLGKRYHDRLRRTRTELAMVETAFGEATNGARVQYEPLPVGPNPKPGIGLIVTDALCRAAIGTGPATPAAVAIPPPIVTPVAQAHGCAGCGAGSDAGFAIVVVFGLVRRRASRAR